LDFDFDLAIVTMKMLALAFVIDETMTVTKMDLLGYLMNDRTSSYSICDAVISAELTWYAS